MAGLRQRVHEVLDIPSQPGDRVGRAFDNFITALIALNAAAVIVETVGDLGERYRLAFFAFELASVAIFAVEYLLRLWSITVVPRYAHPVTGRLRFMATPMQIVDLLAILPIFFVGTDLRFIRVVRILRVLKLGRYAESFRVLGEVARRRREALLMSLMLVAVALVLCSSFMYYAEHEAQPEAYASIPHAMYWGIITLATVGYGDVVPITTAGKVVAGLTAIVGIGVLALPVGIIAAGFVEELEARGKKEVCPHCHKPLRSTKRG